MADRRIRSYRPLTVNTERFSLAAVSAKRRQILDGAREVFSEQGYERATVDQIAARAGVSKATVYNHFDDKQALFVAAVVEVCDDLEGSAEVGDDRAGDVEQALRALGEHLMRLWLSPRVVSLYRQVIAEAGRIPEIGRLVFERGTVPYFEMIAAHLRRWSERGALRIDDPRPLHRTHDVPVPVAEDGARDPADRPPERGSRPGREGRHEGSQHAEADLPCPR